MRYTQYLILAFILPLFVNCSDNNKETPGILILFISIVLIIDNRRRHQVNNDRYRFHCQL